jgi:exodeoxyribonuclease VII small subunit
MATPGSPPTPRRTSKVAGSTPTGEAETGVRAGETADPGSGTTTPGPAIDQVLGELERVVAELEAGDLPLETALKRFEDGVRLARQGGQLLDAVEQRVEMLLEGREGTAPFPGAHEDDGEDDDDDSV